MKPPGDDMLDALIDGRAGGDSQGRPSGFQLSEMMLLLMLASVQFTSIVDFMVVMPLGPQLKRLLGIDSSQFGLIVSSYTISARGSLRSSRRRSWIGSAGRRRS